MTFSIVGRDPRSGSLGVATATAGPVVGQLVPHGRAGTGAIATQSRTNPYFGYDGLELLADPAAFAANARLSGNQGFTLDPIVALRRRIRVRPNKKVAQRSP